MTNHDLATLPDAFKNPHGTTFTSPRVLPVTTLSASLCKVASFLQRNGDFGPLVRYDDWWEHDGLHFNRGKIDFHELFEMLGTAQSVFEATPSDEHVCTGVAPIGAEWYLRFRAEWDEHGRQISGRFDLTLPPILAETFRREELPEMGHPVFEVAADEFFQRIID